MAATRLDVILLGATGFTGKLACEYLATYGDKVSWAMAGRDQAKLEATRASLPTKSQVQLFKLGLFKEELVELAKKTKVLLNFAGSPYADKALPVVEACASTGCCYIDITAEVPFIKTSINRYDAAAKQSSALVLHSCGFDSVPTELGALMAANEMRKRHDVSCSAIRNFVAASGGFSGGTLHSLMHMYQAKGVENYEALLRPYGLDPPEGHAGPDTCDGGSIDQLPGYDPLAGQWIMPWVMAPINVRNVRRSNALTGYSYGSACSVGEALLAEGPLQAFLTVLVLNLFFAMLVFPPTRWFLCRYLLPAPGQGPDRQSMDEGYFNAKTVAVGEGADAPKVVAFVQSVKSGDPGYKSTALMSVECALCCALERDRCADGGVLTPAVGLGQVLIDRLNRAGMKLFVEAAP